MKALSDRNVSASLYQQDIIFHDPISEDLHSSQVCKKIAEKCDYFVMVKRIPMMLSDKEIAECDKNITKMILFKGL